MCQKMKFIARLPNRMHLPSDLIRDSIFISSFDSSPLAPYYNFILKDNEDDFQHGIDIISRLTKGKVYLNIDANSDQHNIFNNITGVVTNVFSGPHPSGNVGVQTHHIKPINKGDKVWYINPQDVITISRLFRSGKVNPFKTIAITGSDVIAPKYIKTRIGSSVKELLENKLKSNKSRVISGNILTGKNVTINGFEIRKNERCWNHELPSSIYG